MASLSKLFDSNANLGRSDRSLAALLVGLGAGSLRTAFASAPIGDYFRRTGGKFGPLGPLDGPAIVLPNGNVQQQYQLGKIDLLNIDSEFGACEAKTFYQANVCIAGIKCYGTQDIGDDETFAVVSLVSVNPNGTDDDRTVTIRTPIKERVQPGDFLFKMFEVGSVAVTGSGIRITVSIWDHESGDADEIRDKIAEFIKDSTNRAAKVLAGGAAAGDPSVTAGTVGDVTEFEVGGVKPFHILTLRLAEVLANVLADDLIDEHEFFIPAENVKRLFNNNDGHGSFRPHTGDWDPDVQVNWPLKVEHDILMTDGAGTYKVFFYIKVNKVEESCIPAIL